MSKYRNRIIWGLDEYLKLLEPSPTATSDLLQVNKVGLFSCTARLVFLFLRLRFHLDVSSNIFEVIRSVLNFLFIFFFYDKISQVQKSIFFINLALKSI